MLETTFIISTKLLVVACALGVVALSRNPIHSILSLIGVVMGISFITLYLGANFFGLILIVVYVGAIVIMFVFVIMMLDLQNVDLAGKFNLYLGFLMLTYLVIPIFFFKQFFFRSKYISKAMTPYYNWYDWALSFDNIKLIGEVLYMFNHLYIVLAGLILFVATIAAVVLSNPEK